MQKAAGGFVDETILHRESSLVCDPEELAIKREDPSMPSKLQWTMSILYLPDGSEETAVHNLPDNAVIFTVAGIVSLVDEDMMDCETNEITVGTVSGPGDFGRVGVDSVSVVAVDIDDVAHVVGCVQIA